ncbi:hypothetical protein [Desulfosporosinus sp. FKB]|uniref:hypothetical protein n=1 Tax=Desulfosporosinus sp. FKB TaxID=1969835 RepID=UPI000B4A1373|nr:hypothetical protein [Desulfosporosinus sp. FKB]
MKSEIDVVPLPKVSVASMLPYGSMLMPLLNDSCLTDSDINNVLKSRGVFVGDSNKKNTIPLIVTMILSPKEFATLQERQGNKEDNPKHRNSIIKSKSDTSLTSVISGFEVNVDKIEQNENIQIITPMMFGFISSNELELEYSIIREDLTRDWVRPQSTHSAKINIRKDLSSKEIRVSNEYTSKETDEINKILIKDLVSFLKEKDEVEDRIETVHAKNFTNRERFNFMLSLAQDTEDKMLEFLEIKDVEIGPDPDNPPKNPKSFFQENVKKVIINGNKLERNILLTDDGEKDNLLFRSIEAVYSFNCNGVKGRCILQYGFMHFFRNQNTSEEFQVALLFLNTKPGLNKKNLNRFVLNKFEELKRKQFDAFKKEANG